SASTRRPHSEVAGRPDTPRAPRSARRHPHTRSCRAGHVSQTRRDAGEPCGDANMRDMKKESYKSLAWAGMGAGAILIFFNFAAMDEPQAPLIWVGIGLIVLGIWAAARAKNFDAS